MNINETGVYDSIFKVPDVKDSIFSYVDSLVMGGIEPPKVTGNKDIDDEEQRQYDALMSLTHYNYDKNTDDQIGQSLTNLGVSMYDLDLDPERLDYIKHPEILEYVKSTKEVKVIDNTRYGSDAHMLSTMPNILSNITKIRDNFSPDSFKATSTPLIISAGKIYDDKIVPSSREVAVYSIRFGDRESALKNAISSLNSKLSVVLSDPTKQVKPVRLELFKSQLNDINDLIIDYTKDDISSYSDNMRLYVAINSDYQNLRLWIVEKLYSVLEARYK